MNQEFTKLFSLYKRRTAGIILTLVDTMDGLFTGGAFLILLLIKIRQYYYIVRLKNIDTYMKIIMIFKKIIMLNSGYKHYFVYYKKG